MIIPCLKKVFSHNNLSQRESYECMLNILLGNADDVQLAAFLGSLHVKGVTVEELTGFALAMRQLSIKVNLSSFKVVDSCGTGGDKFKTFNVSTAAAIIAASSGVQVAKHGNRSITSNCGGADILDALGVNVDGDAQNVVDCLEEVGIGFMNAPNFHPALKNVTSVRKKMGIPTVFNLLGPLCSPAQPKIQLLGVFDPSLVRIMASALQNLGVERAMVVHGFDHNDQPAMDEISTIGRTRIAFLDKGDIFETDIFPEDFGVDSTSPDDLRAPKTREEHIQIIKKVLSGQTDNFADEKRFELSLVNASAILYINGQCADLETGCEIARKNVNSGQAFRKLQALIRVSQS
jgi:anthranilate phosphoribosyltransferase